MQYQAVLQTILDFLRSRRGIACVTLILGALVVYSIMQTLLLFWAFIVPSNSVVPLLQANKKVQVKPSIATWHLFGVYQNNEAALLPKTQLHLDLQGIFFSRILSRSQALIAGSDRLAKPYHAGEEVPGGAIIERILPDSVILKRDGKLEVLTITRPKLEWGQPIQ